MNPNLNCKFIQHVFPSAAALETNSGKIKNAGYTFGSPVHWILTRQSRFEVDLQMAAFCCRAAGRRSSRWCRRSQLMDPHWCWWDLTCREALSGVVWSFAQQHHSVITGAVSHWPPIRSQNLFFSWPSLINVCAWAPCVFFPPTHTMDVESVLGLNVHERGQALSVCSLLTVQRHLKNISSLNFLIANVVLKSLLLFLLVYVHLSSANCWSGCCLTCSLFTLFLHLSLSALRLSPIHCSSFILLFYEHWDRWVCRPH